MDIDEILKKVANTSSSKEKIALLEKENDNEGLKQVLQFVFDPLITTGISKAKIHKEVNVEPDLKVRDIFSLIDYLKINNTGKDKDIATIQRLISLFPEYEEFTQAIATKDLQIGATASTLNKAFGKDFIREFKPQKGSNYLKYNKPLKGSFTITQKMDGIRCIAFKYSNDNIVFIARSGAIMEGYSELKEQMKDLPNGFVYDGELLAFNPSGLSSKELFNKTQSITRMKGEKYGLQIYLFDMLPIEEFNATQSKEVYSKRFNMLHYYVEKCSNEYIKQVKVYYIGEDESVILPLLEKVVAEGLEGLMIAMNNGHYKKGRTTALFKVKKMQTVDLRVVGYKGYKYPNQLGCFIVDYKGYEVSATIDKPQDRIDFWKIKDDLIGTIVEVQYFEETTNKKDDSLSLRFPKFKRLRDDKDEVSYE